MKTLYLIRHAKSSWDNAFLKDFDRPLNARGKRDAPNMAKRLTRDQIFPDAIVTSPAKRAITTAKKIALGINFSKEKIESDPNIYEASSSTMLQIINKLDNQHNTYFLFGHNPSFTYLAEQLSGEYFGNIPTCGIVGIEFPFDSWDMISANTGNCIYHNYPKKEIG